MAYLGEIGNSHVHRRRMAVAKAPEGMPASRYATLGKRDLFIDFAGRKPDGHPVHGALASLQTGDKVTLERNGRGVAVFDRGRVEIGRLSKSAGGGLAGLVPIAYRARPRTWSGRSGTRGLRHRGVPAENDGPGVGVSDSGSASSRAAPGVAGLGGTTMRPSGPTGVGIAADGRHGLAGVRTGVELSRGVSSGWAARVGQPSRLVVELHVEATVPGSAFGGASACRGHRGATPSGITWPTCWSVTPFSRDSGGELELRILEMATRRLGEERTIEVGEGGAPCPGPCGWRRSTSSIRTCARCR